MPKRFQKGNVRKIHGSWIGRYYDEDGVRQSVTLGRVSEMSKSEAREKLAEILRPINAGTRATNSKYTFRDFVRNVFFPRKRRKWKLSTRMTTEDRIETHLVAEFGNRLMVDFIDDELQALLDSKTNLSFSVVDHLKWDMVSIFRMALAKKCITWNPAAPEMLETPRECKKLQTVRFMTEQEGNQVGELIEELPLRERLIMKFALIAGMRPGEIFGLKRGDAKAGSADVLRRVYRGDIDTPKNGKAREAAVDDSLARDLSAWLDTSPDTGSDGWLFPSERLETALWADNIWRRHIRPRLQEKGFGWVCFQVLRRTSSSRMRANGVDPKVVADQLGHTLDVNLNVYTQETLERKKEAVETVASSLVH